MYRLWVQMHNYAIERSLCIVSSSLGYCQTIYPTIYVLLVVHTTKQLLYGQSLVVYGFSRFSTLVNFIGHSKVPHYAFALRVMAFH